LNDLRRDVLELIDGQVAEGCQCGTGATLITRRQTLGERLKGAVEGGQPLRCRIGAADAFAIWLSPVSISLLFLLRLLVALQGYDCLVIRQHLKDQASFGACDALATSTLVVCESTTRTFSVAAGIDSNRLTEPRIGSHSSLTDAKSQAAGRDAITAAAIYSTG
jgi:hypothetical protein